MSDRDAVDLGVDLGRKSCSDMAPFVRVLQQKPASPSSCLLSPLSLPERTPIYADPHLKTSTSHFRSEHGGVFSQKGTFGTPDCSPQEFIIGHTTLNIVV